MGVFSGSSAYMVSGIVKDSTVCVAPVWWCMITKSGKTRGTLQLVRTENTKAKTVTVPAKVKKIGDYAFYGCKGLKTITLDTTLLSADTVSERAFRGFPAGVAVSVPKKKDKAYKTLLVKLGLSKKATIKSMPLSAVRLMERLQKKVGCRIRGSST